MIAAERREAILKLVQGQGAVYVPDLSQRFQTSSSTIRRDLEWLASRGELTRTYGGAIAVADTPCITDLPPVDDVASRIGRAAASLIMPGEAVQVV